jgi:hypothetical protein
MVIPGSDGRSRWLMIAVLIIAVLATCSSTTGYDYNIPDFHSPTRPDRDDSPSNPQRNGSSC